MVGYAALAFSAVDLSAAPAPLARHAPDPVPALLVGRLAVDLSMTGHRLGTTLVNQALAVALDASRGAGLRAVIVHAIDIDAVRFYEHLGLSPLSRDDPFDLYILTKDLAATLGSPP